jgi:branched-chain amino acid transport system permease protein
MFPKIYTRGTPVHRAYQVVGWTLLGLATLWVVYGAENYMVTKFSIALSFSIAILGLNLVTGYSGQISLGHSAFFGVGAYSTAILMADHDWPYLATIPVAAALGAAVGFVVGLPALRIRGLYLALITLAIAIVFPVLLKRFDWLTGGANGKTVNIAWTVPGWLPGDVSRDDWKFLWVAAIAGALFLLSSNLIRSRVGRGLMALRDNEIGAAVSGVHPAGFKTAAFATSALVASVGGTTYTLAVGTVSPDSFGLIRSIEFIAGLVVGGVATIAGNLLGGLIIEFLPYYTSTWLEGPRANVLLGLFLIAVIFIAPGGLMWGIRQVRAKIILFIPKLPTLSSVRQGEEPALAASVAAPDTTEQGGDA